MKSLVASFITVVINFAYIVDVTRHNLGVAPLFLALPTVLRELTPVIMVAASLFSKPLKADERWSMFFVAVLASNMFVLLHFTGFQLVSPDRSIPIAIAAQLVTLALIPFYVYAVVILGRQLTVMPEARKLITRGPYAISRHPLYLIYIIWFVLQIAIAQTLVIVVLTAAIVALLVLRAQGEEALLARAFPAEWDEYSRRVGWIWRWSPPFASQEES